MTWSWTQRSLALMLVMGISTTFGVMMGSFQARPIVPVPMSAKEGAEDLSEVTPPPPEPALDLLAIELEACRDRTEHLRWTLEALIPVWPGHGRARLPMPPEGWPAWPEIRSNIGSPMGKGAGRHYGQRHPITDEDLEKLY